jgi:integration host factor subunit beta
MNTITKKLLVDQIAQRTGHKRVVVKQIVQEFLDQVIDEIEQGNRLEFRDFGVFEVRERAPRMAQNPKTLERVPVPAKRTVKFKPGRRMREGLDTPTNDPASETSKANTKAQDSGAAARARDAEPKPEIHVNTTNAREEAVAAS